MQLKLAQPLNNSSHVRNKKVYQIIHFLAQLCCLLKSFQITRKSCTSQNILNCVKSKGNTNLFQHVKDLKFTFSQRIPLYVMSFDTSFGKG